MMLNIVNTVYSITSSNIDFNNLFHVLLCLTVLDPEE